MKNKLKITKGLMKTKKEKYLNIGLLSIFRDLSL